MNVNGGVGLPILAKLNGQNTSALFTDFYELTMAQGYWKQKMDYPVVFDMFFRNNPFNSGFSVFSGIQTLLDALTSFTFQKEDLDYLQTLGTFDKKFIDYLKDFTFSGDLYAFEEGSIIFPQEPIIRIHAGLIEAQIIEGLVLNQVNFQSLIATKATRVWLSSKKGSIMEFGLRRAQGADGAMSASRAAFIGGCAGTSNTLAGRIYGIPVLGTMAHSWIMSFPTELEAFEAYAKIYPDNAIFLIDTYDTLNSGIKNAIKVGAKLAEQGYNFGVRLDSGDIHYLSIKCREALDNAGFPQATISVSNELTEQIIEQLLASGAPINSWGVGTHMVTGGDASSFTGVYKLSARHNKEGATLIPTMKVSDNPAKTTNPGVKNVWRLFDSDNMAQADILALDDEIISTATETVFYHPAIDYRRFKTKPARVENMLVKQLENGRQIQEKLSEDETIRQSRKRMNEQLKTFDPSYQRILNPHIYKVSLSEKLKDLKSNIIHEH
ncbi:MAG TPA: nicotinate phosphoribosyltransferase, partial [Treponemataceae bacterium]|nr:nicotinate phosphoribosyltransferase [Treponemataceae bacterium]